ncbi:MAG: NADH-quinone oxidoreductase subunit K [Natronospirillum sp.]|uniref:NADH-quinone oxidoreductase subunit K n=1 Tax=Natronospirillum sp. TaxID=2812955 RepID=UPI0025F95D5C|nr:NADH-quinone oxidoreductase subunit K [Natronospirillum sp.]MCH8551540.1 NADH-quinone oxidoreductase subunit K [Natronospirillum sp.]
MTQVLFYLILGVCLWALGLYGLLRLKESIRRIISVNIMGSGVFMVMVALAARSEDPDPVMHALVVTGLVVAISATAFALRLSVADVQEDDQ